MLLLCLLLKIEIQQLALVTQRLSITTIKSWNNNWMLSFYSPFLQTIGR